MYRVTILYHLKISTCQPKNFETCKETGKCDLYIGIFFFKAGNRNCSWRDPDVAFSRWRLQSKGSLVRFPVRAHAWVVGQVPGWRHARGNHTLMFLSLSFFLPSVLSKKKINKIFKFFKKEQREKRMKKMDRISNKYGTSLSAPTYAN